MVHIFISAEGEKNVRNEVYKGSMGIILNCNRKGINYLRAFCGI